MSGFCDCGHAKADHIRGKGACTATYDVGGEDDCGCGVFEADDDMPQAHEWSVCITTKDGLGSFAVKAAPDAPPDLRDALHAIAQEAYRRLEKVPAQPESDEP